VRIYTLGFTKKSAEDFFESLEAANVKRVVDVRLNNRSQLSGFAKKTDLSFFLSRICGIEYRHEPLLAPTKEILNEYKKQGGSWEAYERQFAELMESRKIEVSFPPELFADSCLLCSEDKPHRCHRRLVAEYLNKHWGGIEILHINANSAKRR
jgi:uncharacterized protein (DUF488 family)